MIHNIMYLKHLYLFLHIIPHTAVWLCGIFTQQSSGGGTGVSQDYIIGVRDANYQIGYEWTECVGCMNCIGECQANAISIHSDGFHVVLDYTKCQGNKDCIIVCPANGIALFE